VSEDGGGTGGMGRAEGTGRTAGTGNSGGTRSGFVALAGRPNVGKSTLVNALVGEKVAIVSDRPQTTRRAIRGVRSTGDCQIVLVDLPGVQRPRDALTERMAQRVRQELEGCDAALMVLNGEQGVGPGDRFIAQVLAGAGADQDASVRARATDENANAHARTSVTIAVNKVDRLARAETIEVLEQAVALGISEDVFPISARTGAGVDALVEHLAAAMPEGPFMFGAGASSDQPRAVLLAELVREAVIKRTFHELPHAVEVVVEEIEWVGGNRNDLARVRALIWVESESQKGILIGARGRMIKAIGVAARRELERELGCQVHLDLSVRVRRDWRGDEGLLDRLGIT
jgi:GTP-binding protein Era